MAIINMRAMSAIRETFVLPVRVLIRFLQTLRVENCCSCKDGGSAILLDKMRASDRSHSRRASARWGAEVYVREPFKTVSA